MIELGTGANGGNKLLFYCGSSKETSYTVPSGVTSASPFCFAEAEFLRQLTLPDGLTEIPFAFAVASKIESVNIPASVTKFSTEIVSSDKTEEGEWGNVMQWGIYGAFLDCNGLKTVTFADGNLTTIPSYAFYNIGIQSLSIPACITTIEDYAFRATALKSIEVAEQNKSYAAVDGLLYTADKKKLVLYPAGKEDVTYTVPTGTTTIGNCSFNGCYILEHIIFPEGVTTFETNAFNSCYEAEYDQTTWELISEKGLKTVELPSTVQTIGDFAFSGCNLLEKVTFKSTTVPTLQVNEYTTRSTFGYQYNDSEGNEVSVIYDKLKFVVPEEAFSEYYQAFYEYNPTYIKGFTVPDSLKITYSFDSKGGTQLDPVEGLMLTELPYPEKQGYYFWGWYLTDASATGEWGDPVALPYTAEGDVTLYARWETERFQDGTSLRTAYEITATPRVLALVEGQRVYFQITPSVDCYFLFDDFNSDYWWSYYIYDIANDENPEYTDAGYLLGAGRTYAINFYCYGSAAGGESWDYTFRPVFADVETGEPLEALQVLPAKT